MQLCQLCLFKHRQSKGIYIVSDRPTALFIFDDLDFLVFIWGCQWAKWGQSQLVQRGKGGYLRGAMATANSAEGHKAREEIACLRMMENPLPWASQQSPMK